MPVILLAEVANKIPKQRTLGGCPQITQHSSPLTPTTKYTLSQLFIAGEHVTKYPVSTIFLTGDIEGEWKGEKDFPFLKKIKDK